MDIEYEATFKNINKDSIRDKLEKIGAKLIKPEFLQKRVNFTLPKNNEVKGGWLRIRDEGDRITMSLKVVDGNRIHDQKEVMLVVNDFEEAKKFLLSIGCQEKAYQETKRELWELNGAEVAIDEWPFLEPFVEIESTSENQVKTVAEKLGFDYSQAKFCAVDIQYSDKYGIDTERINTTPRLVFDMENPFINHELN